MEKINFFVHLCVMATVLSINTHAWGKNKGGVSRETIVITKKRQVERADAVRQLLRKYKDVRVEGTGLYAHRVFIEEREGLCASLELMHLVDTVMTRTLEQYPQWRDKKVKYSLKIGNITVNGELIFSDWSGRVSKAEKFCADLPDLVPQIIHVYEEADLADLRLLRNTQESVSKRTLSCMAEMDMGCKKSVGGSVCRTGAMSKHEKKRARQACICERPRWDRVAYKELIGKIREKHPEWLGKVIHYVKRPHERYDANVFIPPFELEADQIKDDCSK